MAQMLSQVPLNEIAIGDNLTSYTGRPGVITEITPEGTGSALEDSIISIVWSGDGKPKSESVQYHYALDKVVYIGK